MMTMIIILGGTPHEVSVTPAVYTPGDLERISGLRADMQRVWRRRGQLPPLESGHARFSIQQAVEITFRYAMSKVGIPPSEVELDLSSAARAAIFHGVLAYGGCEAIGPSGDVDAFLSEFADDNGKLGLSLVGYQEASCLKPSNYMVLNEWHETRIVDDPNDLVSGTEELSLVFNLKLVGERLVERSRKPVVSVRFSDRAGQRTVRRLTGVGANDT
jgi:hypothetical protein